MLGNLDLQRINEEAAHRLEALKKPVESSPPPVRGELVLKIYTTTHNRTSRTYQGKTGPFMHDINQVNGWHSHEVEEAVAAMDKLQKHVGLDSIVTVDIKPSK